MGPVFRIRLTVACTTVLETGSKLAVGSTLEEVMPKPKRKNMIETRRLNFFKSLARKTDAESIKVVIKTNGPLKKTDEML